MFSPRPWGVLSLAPFFPDMSSLSSPVGEAWMTGNQSVFADGPFAGRQLGQAWPAMPAAWRGAAIPAAGLFPILTKFIFSEDKLSLQVHPDDAYAAKHEAAAGGIGKTEMWYALRSRPGAEVLAGFKPGVTALSFREAMVNGNAEDCLEHVPLAEGESIFIPARTAHTIGPGFVLCEIQQHSDLTYRLYDYNRLDAEGRARELHIDKALAVVRFGQQTCGKPEPVRIDREGAKETYIVACRYFATEKWEFSSPISRSTLGDRFEVLILLDGTGEIAWDGGRTAYARAHTYLFPASLGTYRLLPTSHTSLLRTFVPGDRMDFEDYFAQRGVGKSDWARLMR
jgi:mannose-6-phosphate isomerase